MHKLKINLNDSKNFLELEVINTKDIKKFNYFWLRDHCRCNECYNTKTHQIAFDILKIPLDIKPKDVQLNEDYLNILWCDDHNSQFSISWLLNLEFPSKLNKIFYWDNNNINDIIKNVTLSHDEYFKNDGCKKLLQNLLKYGFGFISNVPLTNEATKNVVEHLAPVHKTYFGEMWEVSNDLLHKDTAYTTVALGAHNDNTYFNEAAGLQVFHMLSHDGTGGETLLVDGFNAANNLKLKDENSYNILCTKTIEAEYIENDVHYSYINNVINLHPLTKQLNQIRYNVYDRALLNTMSQNDVFDFYKAYKQFGEEINNKKNQFWMKLQPGTVLFFDNWRLLHGRGAYTGSRKLIGAYIGRSDWLARAKGFHLI